MVSLRDRIWRFILLLKLSFLMSCGGSGGPTAPSDTTPPLLPTLSLISLSLAAGHASIIGVRAAVEPSSTVRVENQTSHVAVQVQADPSGSFSLSIQASFGDRLHIVAIDAARNMSPTLEISVGLLTLGDIQTVFLPTGAGTFSLLYATAIEEHLLVLESSSALADVVSVTFNTSLRPQPIQTPRPPGIRTTDPQATLELRRWKAVDEFLKTHDNPHMAKVSPLRLQGTPALGNTEFFWGEDPFGSFESRPAFLEFIGSHVLIFVDQRIPQEFISTAQIQVLGNAFDPTIYMRDRALFGVESDVDGNGRIKILFTPSVNFLGPGVLGFFHPLDLVTREPVADILQGANTPQRRVERRSKRAAITRQLGAFDNPEAVRRKLHAVENTLDGFVHAAYPHIMEMYGGSPDTEEFHLRGTRVRQRIEPMVRWISLTLVHGLNAIIKVLLDEKYGREAGGALEARRALETADEYPSA